MFFAIHDLLFTIHVFSMRVAVISAEAVPYSKTGGLGDVAPVDIGTRASRRERARRHTPTADPEDVNRQPGKGW